MKIVEVLLFEKVRNALHVKVEVPDDFGVVDAADKQNLVTYLYNALLDLDRDNDEHWEFDECMGMDFAEVRPGAEGAVADVVAKYDEDAQEWTFTNKEET